MSSHSNTNPYFKTSIFWKLCCVYDHIVVHTLIRYCSTTTNEFWDALRDILDASGILYSVLADELQEEVINTKEVHTLFRVNSGPTSLLSAVLRKELTPLMEKYINPIIHSCNSTEIHIDSTDETIKSKSIETINKYIDIHTTRFLQMASEFPENLKSIFGIIKEVVEENFQEEGVSQQILSALFFHKIITPAIVTPSKFCSAISIPTDKGKSVLVLLSKIYQTFVNQCDEPFPKTMDLNVFNSTIVNSYPKINEMVNILSSNSTLPEYHFNKVVSSQLLLRKVPPILSTLETMKPAAMVTIIQPFIDIGFKNLAENLLALTSINIYQKELAKLDLKKPKDVGIFFDETEEACYNSVITGYEDTINFYQKRINTLTEEIFKLNQIIEKFDAPSSPRSFTICCDRSPCSSQPQQPICSPKRSKTPSCEEQGQTTIQKIQELHLPSELNDELRNRFITLTSKENQIVEFVNKTESVSVLSKSDKFITVYVKATKTKLKDECPKIAQKDKDKEKKDKDKKDKDKAVAKLKKSCLEQLKEAHENRNSLLQHIDDPKLMQRIFALVNILDDIIYVLNN
ncbi:hypothetical protein ENUP19_0298G0091 [Entamoeba nuttalli]|uniref:Ras GTPase-activating protein, putative n=2 Tax=Entamoeba nuttalli TaxID=412467 RepID=K2I0R2_ENTNP|nr:Ras GTPase-activating protein, putative [Entamoeba nuttalli P19]EKE42350.1 Ras GTPase-activating protein, putative [Entamoeba nuttalli P19]|eukprot:XP_008855316.1 Ras GTPase-activating protein, putative [Entamoeba nuttalli P19]